MNRACLWGLLIPLLVLITVGYFSYRSLAQITPGGQPPTLTASLNNLVSSFSQAVKSLGGNKSPAGTGLVAKKPVPILMYHYIRDNVDQAADPIGYGLSVPPSEFKAQLDYLQKAGYTTIHLTDLLTGNYPEKSIILTFDDGYADFLSQAWPILKAHGFTATIFVISGRLNNPAHLSANDVVYLANQGVEIGSHTINHVNLANQKPEALYKELAESRQSLSNLTEKETLTIAYPSGQYNDQTLIEAAKIGYKLGVTTHEGIAFDSDPLTLSRLRMKKGLSLAVFKALIVGNYRYR